jgi:PAS domain-containing protein
MGDTFMTDRPWNVELDAIEKLFDAMTEVAFFVKDRDGRYVAVNNTLARRCGLRNKSDILGKTVMDVHPRPLAAAYEAQDRQVIDMGATIEKHRCATSRAISSAWSAPRTTSAWSMNSTRCTAR